MEDKELFHYFKSRSTSFDEMPSDELWNKIQHTTEISKKTSLTISKIALLTGLTLAIVTVIIFFINKNNKPTIKNESIYLKEIEAKDLKDSLKTPFFQENDTALNSIKLTKDTLKKRKNVLKKSIFELKKDTILLSKTMVPILKMDSIEFINPKIFMDTLNIKPQVKGNRLLFETKEVLSKTEFDAFIQKVLKQTERNFGSLIVIKAKGHKPFRHLVKLDEKIKIPHKEIKPILYTTKIILKDSLIPKDSIYFNPKK